MSVPFDFRMQLILSLSREISASVDLSRILRFLRASISTFMPHVIWMNIFEVHERGIKPVDSMKEDYIESNKEFLEVIKSRKEYTYIEDIEDNELHYHPFIEDAKSVLWIPVKKWDRVEGLWVIESKVSRGFKLEDIIFSRIIADFVGVSISNIRLLRENEERKRDFQSAYEISLQINRPLKKRELIKLFLKLIAERLESVYASFFEKKKDVLYLIEYYSPYENVFPVNTQFLKGEGLVGTVFEKGETIYVNDVTSSNKYKKGIEGIKSEMSVPVFWQNELIGVIDIGRKKDFSSNEIFLSNLLTNTFSIAYQNVKYYEELKRYINEMEKVVEEKSQELVKSEKFALIGQMSSVVIHEIKNLLSGISAMSELILLKVDDEKVKEIAEMMKEEAKKAFANLSNILEYVRPIELKLEKVDLQEILDKSIPLSEGFFKDKKIDMKIEIAKDLPAIPMDKERIKEVFINLISNAAQAIEKKGFIKIKGYKENGFVVIEIEDNGKGIKKEDLKRIFEPFFTTRKGGTGIGLARVKKILDYHSWDVNVKSEPGKGSVFRIKIPLRI